MILLKRAQVFKYKSIDDSTPVVFGDDVTALVGKNESGKTAFLEALHKALPLFDAKFNVVFDYPRRDYIRYLPQHEAKQYAKVVELTFEIGEKLATRINAEVFGNEQVITPEHTFTRTTTYGNTNTVLLGLKEVSGAFRNPKRDRRTGACG